MKFLIKEISPSRKEVRVTLNTIDTGGISYFILGSIGGNFDEGTINSKYLSPELSSYYSVGPNPGIIRTLVAYLKDTLGTPIGYANTALVTKNNKTIPVVNIAIDDITLLNLSSNTIPSMVIKLLEALPDSENIFDEISVEKITINTQEQEVYFISATEPPAVIRGLAYDDGLRQEVGDATLKKVKYESYNELTSSFQHADNTIIQDIISGSGKNLKVDYSDFSNHVHFGSAVSKVDNFCKKVKNIEDKLLLISKSLSTGSMASVDLFRKNQFLAVQDIKNTFTGFEEALYYKSDMLSYNNSINLGPNFASAYPVSKHRSKPILNYNGLNLVYHCSGSITGSTGAAGGTSLMFRNVYNAEDKPFYNSSGSFYLSFLMKGDENQRGKMVWANNQKNNIPMLPKPTLYTSSLNSGIYLNPDIQSESWNRYVFQASSSYWAPHIDNPIIGAPGTITDFDTENEITIFSGSGVSGSYPIVAGSRYTNLTTTISSSGASITASIVPAGELFRIFTHTPGLHASSSYLADIKITKYNPSGYLPFSEVYRTGSVEYGNWYTEMYTSASEYDRENVHSLMRTLPAYLGEGNVMDNETFSNFVNMMGENFDLCKVYIDGYGDIFNTQYGSVGAVPDNLLPIVAQNYNWRFALPFGRKDDANLINFMGSTLSNLNTTSNTKNNIWRNLVNNMNYMYKNKGTQNSIRSLLNSYGFPPDILKVKEHGSSMDQADNEALSEDSVPILGGLGGEGNSSFTEKEENFVMYIMDADPARLINLDWRRNDVIADGVEFVFKPSKGFTEQIILESSGSGNKKQWELVLEPSASSQVSSRLSFRISNTEFGSADTSDTTVISPNPLNVSMSTDYFRIKNQNYWNVLIQRTRGPQYSDTTAQHDYEMYIGEQKGDKLRNLEKVEMSYVGSEYSHSQANWIGTGSRHKDHSGNLVFGQTMTGSIAEIRTWKYPLSASSYKQHIFDKKSAVGNGATDSQTNLLYHYRLNENYISGSANPQFKDANPKNGKDYSIPFTGSLTASMASRPLYDLDTYDRIQFNVGIGGSYEPSDNSIIIFTETDRRYIDNLNPFSPSLMSVYHPLINKRKASSLLEITKSPQEVINDFILNQLGNFDFNDMFADPRDIGAETYDDLEDFAKQFFDHYDVSLDINRYIRATAAIFNEDLIRSIKRLAPARAQFSKVGVEVKPTFLERQKLAPPSIEKQILSFEADIPFTDWEKDMYSLHTIDNLQPAGLTKDVQIELASITGSKEYYDFTEQYELWLPHQANFDIKPSGLDLFDFTNLYEVWPTQDVNIELASPTGSSAGYYDFTNKWELYRTRNTNFNITPAGVDMFDFTNLYEIWVPKDVNIELASPTGSSAGYYDFTTQHELIQPMNNDELFDVERYFTSSSRLVKFSNALYDYHKTHIEPASATGSHPSYDAEYNPSRDYNFDLSSDKTQGVYRFNQLMPEYKNNDLYIFNVDDYYQSGSDSRKLRWRQELYKNNDLHIFDADKYYNSGSSAEYLRFEQEIYKTNDLHILDARNYFKSGSTPEYLNFQQEVWKHNDLQLLNMDNVFQSGSDKIKFIQEMYKNNDLIYYNIDDHFKPNSEIIQFNQEMDSDINLNIMSFGHTGSKFEEYSYELCDYKDINLMSFGHTGSQYVNFTDNHEFYDYKNLDLYEGFNYFKSGSETEKLTWRSEIDVPTDLHIFDIHNFYKSGSDGRNLRWRQELYKNHDLYILNTDNYYNSGSSAEHLTFRQEMYKNNDLHIFDIHDYWTSGSNSVQFNNYIVDDKNLKLVNISDDFNSNKDGEYLSFNPEVYEDRKGNLDYPVNINSDETYPLSLTPIEYEYKDIDVSVANATSSNPDMNSQIFLPYEGIFNFVGNTTFYEHAFKSFSELSDLWGRTEDDVKFLHYANSGSAGDYNTFHYENRYIFHTIGDVESISGSYASVSSSFETDFTGIVTAGILTSSVDFRNQRFIKTGQFLGKRPLGTTTEFKPTGSISFKGGKFLDETFVYPANHQFILGSSKDSIDRLIYKGSKNVGGDVLVSEIFTDLDDAKAFYHILITGGGTAPTVNT